MGELKQNIDVIKDMLVYISHIEDAENKFGSILDFVGDCHYRYSVAFCVVRINMLRRWFSEDFRAAYPQLDEKIEMSRPGGSVPDTILLWVAAQKEIPSRKTLLKRLLDEYTLSAGAIAERGFTPPAKMVEAF